LKESDIRKISVVDAEKIELKKGDLIRFTRNTNSLSRRWFTKNNYHRVNNGQVATIKSIRGNTIRLTNGLKIDARLGNFTHGYVFTSYASQGQTKDHVLVSQHGDSLGAATNAEQVYVSVSRGRQSVKIYTDDKARFMKAATRQSDPTTAIDRQEERHERIRVKKVKDWLHRYDNRERVNESGL